jgi:DNA-3-methyladenine glycosylase I
MGERNDGLMEGPDGVLRCAWHANLPDYMHYHDHEWGRPVANDRRLFEKLCLEGFQAGLSWLTILRKRENFRQAFHDFNFERLAGHDERHIEMHMQNAGIIRHREKIASVFNNARRALEMCEKHGSLAKFFWSFEPRPEQRPPVLDYETLKANPKTEYSARLSKELKRLGWSRQPSTRSCRPWAWSMIISRAASAGLSWNWSESSSSGRSRAGASPHLGISAELAWSGCRHEQNANVVLTGTLLSR